MHEGDFGDVTEAVVMDGSNTKALGMLLYTQYLYPLEIAAVLLLVAIISAIALTLRQRKDSKFIHASEQVLAKKADRLRVVKMDAVVPPKSAAGSSEEASS